MLKYYWFRPTVNKICDHCPYTQIVIKKNLLFFKSVFYKNKKVAKIDDIDVNKILVSNEKTYGTKNLFKYFIGYNDNDVSRPLCIKLPEMAGYIRKFEGNTTMSFEISNKQLLKKYNRIWKKVY